MNARSAALAGTGRLVRGTLDAQQNTTRRMVDLLGRVTASIDPLGGATNFAYDAAGNRLSLTDPASFTYTRHTLGRRPFAFTCLAA